MKWLYCPNTGTVIKAFKGDKEVQCNCGRSNPVTLNDNSRRRSLARFFRLQLLEHTEETATSRTVLGTSERGRSAREHGPVDTANFCYYFGRKSWSMADTKGAPWI